MRFSDSITSKTYCAHSGSAGRPRKQTRVAHALFSFIFEQTRTTCVPKIEPSELAKRKIRSLPKSANMIFTGKPRGRDGNFFLQGKETAENGKIKATWFVVPGSATVNSPGFGAKEVLKATLEKGLTDGWIIVSKEAVYECKDNADQVTFGSI
jgi:hypothetical protein